MVEISTFKYLPMATGTRSSMHNENYICGKKREKTDQVHNNTFRSEGKVCKYERRNDAGFR